jgi:glycopeptide antibiotics resistance protein
LVPSLAAGTLAVLAIEMAQLLVYSRFSSTTDVLTGLLAVLIGWGLAAWLVRANAHQFSHPRLSRHLAACLLATAILHALLIATVLCLPFNRWASPLEAQERLQALFTRPPLAAIQGGAELNAMSEMLRKMLLFAPLGALLALVLRAWRDSESIPTRIVGLAVLALVALATGIELLQVGLPPHVADLTDLLLCILGAIGGLAAAIRVLQANNSPN